MFAIPYLLNLLAALALGALIGAERQWRQRMAGLRTNALVAVGAAVFILSSVTTSPDSPGRIAAQVVSGIGFLGAGVIMREGMNIRGLNTAATLWCSAGIGVLCGLGEFGPALTAALVILCGQCSGVDVIVKAYRLYREQCPPAPGEEPLLALTRAWTLVRFVESGMLQRSVCRCCSGSFVTYAHIPENSFTCSLCQPPSRAIKKRKLSALPADITLYREDGIAKAVM
ncbi:hypothetical protein CKG00_06690 [Morganella morganii]|uniref:Protein MgtC n=1 Tax=Morganella morganii TaxID=582 RepID=A0A433ZVD8_MORMO|nr:MgtC/SapB family protein [Morganella morganii]RUT66114.1 hypothetical protein CKG00_06690 [Morganella morganii]